VFRSGQAWTDVTNGRYWAEDSSLGYLQNFNAVADLSADDVYPIYQTLGDNSAEWWFSVDEVVADELEHVFKVTANADGTSVDIGARREDADYQFTDTISIFSDRDGDVETVTKTTVGNVVLTVGTNHIYYEVKNGTSEVWEAEAKSSAVWPPTDADGNQQLLPLLVAQVDFDATTGITIGQELFHNPEMRPKQFLHPFSPIQTDGFVKITAGKVKLDSGTVTIAEQSFATDGTDANYIFVEIVSAPGDTTPNVTATLQENTTEPDYDDETDGTLTRSIVIGHLPGGSDNVYTPRVTDDLNLGTLFQPDYSDDVTPSIDPTAGQFLLYESAATVGEDKDILIRGRKYQIKTTGGDMANAVDDGTYAFGGETATISGKLVSGDSTTNEFTVSGTPLGIELESGLGQELTKGSSSAVLRVTADGIRVGIEPGPNIMHLQVANIEANRWGTLTYDGTTATFDDVTGTDFSIDVGTYGHILGISIDSTDLEPPEDQTNYRYEDCEDSATTRVYDASTDGVFWHDSKCWTFTGDTIDDSDFTLPDVDYTDCSDCLNADTSDLHRWIPCDSTAFVTFQIDPLDGPSDDYAWLCETGGSTYQRYENTGPFDTTDAPSDPAFVEQCGGASSCGELVGWALFDDFNGGICQSSAGNLNTNIWDLVYDPDGGGGSNVVSGGKVRITAASTTGEYGIENSRSDWSGDFFISCDFANISFSPLGQGTSWIGLVIFFVGGGVMNMERNRTSADNWESLGNVVATSATSGTLSIERKGGSSTVVARFDGTLLHSISNGNKIARVIVRANAAGSTTQNVAADINVVRGTDTIEPTVTAWDPTGDAC
jgi:hypothetical protein